MLGKKTHNELHIVIIVTLVADCSLNIYTHPGNIDTGWPPVTATAVAKKAIPCNNDRDNGGKKAIVLLMSENDIPCGRAHRGICVAVDIDSFP